VSHQSNSLYAHARSLAFTEEGLFNSMRFIKVAMFAAALTAITTASLTAPAKALPPCPIGQHLVYLPGVGLVCA
jgi:hypothetical protein